MLKKSLSDNESREGGVINIPHKKIHTTITESQLIVGANTDSMMLCVLWCLQTVIFK